MSIGEPWASPRIESNAQIGAHRRRNRDDGLKARVRAARFHAAIERSIEACDAGDFGLGGGGIDPEPLQVLADRALEVAKTSLNLALDLAVARDITGHEGHTSTGTSPSPYWGLTACFIGCRLMLWLPIGLPSPAERA
jgi:hypothetical protein